MIKRLRRSMAILLAITIVMTLAPAMKTEAAGKAISAKFIDWGRRTISINGEDYTTYDASTSYIGVKKCNATKFYYEVYNADGTRQLRKGEVPAQSDSRYPDYQIAVIPGSRRTSVCSLRIKARIDNKWSAFSGWISLVPPHTPDYIWTNSVSRNGSVNLAWTKFNGMTDYIVYMSTDGRNWTAVKRTMGTSCTISSFKGKKLKTYPTCYYYRVVGRKLFKGKYILAKGNLEVNYRSFYIFDID